jgi:hypothetical protein
MSEHLPECGWDNDPTDYHCICSRLRTAEQRIFDGLTAEFIDTYAPMLEARGALRGLELARKAVEAARDKHELPCPTWNEALRAIKAVG